MKDRLIKLLQNEIGYIEGKNNYNKYSQELYGKSQEWCADFLRWGFEKLGLGSLFPYSSYVPTIAKIYSKKGMYYNSLYYGGKYYPNSGDLILFDKNYNKTSDHIGIVESREKNNIYVIEGNSNNKVERNKYSLNDKRIRAFIKIDYPIIQNDNSEPIKVGDKVEVIKNVIYGTNKTFKLWYKNYDVLEIVGNRAVIGIGKTVTTAIDINYLRKRR